MENLSEPVEKISVPLTIPVQAYLRDHRIGGRVVLPAVEALQIAARSGPANAEIGFQSQKRALFRHPLVIGDSAVDIRMVHEQERYADGRCLSRLTTLLSGRRMRFTRSVEHLSVWFAPADQKSAREAGSEEGSKTGARAANEDDSPSSARIRGVSFGSDKDSRRGVDLATDPADLAPPTGVVFRVPAERLYADLVPFGPAYRNIRGDLLLAETGVSATVYGGDFPEAVGRLGSPFPLDAAMHAACAWGQRYRNRVVFPVGFDRREIFSPARPRENYLCRIHPLPDEKTFLRFNILICGPDRKPVEAVHGLAMKEIFAERSAPPDWIREGIR